MPNTPGSANVAGRISADLQSQTVDLSGAKAATIKFDADATTQTEGAILTSANGTEYKLSVSDVGALTAEAV